jgi:DNA-binding XRE family transcriptional regulator
MKVKVKVTRTTVKFIELDSDNYDENMNTAEEIIKYEKEAAAEYPEYMDECDEESFEFEECD